ncbi:MAG: DUF4298 domain-containing protein [Clostridia bacterium]|nr:DUF4298 domain-containing protein [Clostridia bacterium]
MKVTKTQINRVERYEKIFDEVSAAAKQLSASLEEFEKLLPGAQKLDAYYTGSEWKKDFASDEEGLFPPGMKRGVLSEDGVYNLLEEIREIKERAAALGNGE